MKKKLSIALFATLLVFGITSSALATPITANNSKCPIPTKPCPIEP
ncbi:hypothetical protein [Cytobacillus sp.]|nr:hypothetical protein [Cytobacillus sp.]